MVLIGHHWTRLPEVPILDLKHLPYDNNKHRPNILRAATHGRSVYERILDANVPPNPRNFAQPIQLYIRANILDRGLYDVQDNVNNPINNGNNVRLFDGIDIKVSQSDQHNTSPTCRHTLYIPQTERDFFHGIRRVEG